jgi:hypothetical protein
MEQMNTSQDPEYVGPTYHEKKIHKTHFTCYGTKFRHTSPDKYKWVEIGTGRSKLIPIETPEGDSEV